MFDPIGGFDRPDTAYAPIVVTFSARSGAKGLAATARVTASDLASGGCTTAREAIIVGGTDAVPKGVESELIGLGYREVFRAAGSNRYQTAAQVAGAMGTAERTSDTCVDPTADDGDTRLGWYGNAAFEFRSDAGACRVLPRAVVLADGGTGADALAAGWWTSYWQVPILLTAPDGSLPEATRGALRTLAVDTIVVLGGTQRIPERTVDEAKFLAGAIAGRIAGADRTATSIEMAKAFGGWHPTGNGADFADDVACFVASSGSGAAATGWPDALAAGPTCARVGAAKVGSPSRAMAPAGGTDAAKASTGGRLPSHDAAPIILLPTGEQSLPLSAVAFLGDAFDHDAPWCSGEHFERGCLGPGFGVVIGGDQAVTAGAGGDLTYLLSGGELLDNGDQRPQVSDAFATTLDLQPLFTVAGGPGGPAVCVPVDGLRDVRWLSFTRDVERTSFVTERDVLRLGVLGPDDRSRPTCAASIAGDAPVVSAGVSVSGHVTPTMVWDLSADKHVSLSGPIEQETSPGSGADGASWSVSGPLGAPVTISSGEQSAKVTSADLELHLGPARDGRNLITGSFTVMTKDGSFPGTVVGQALNTGSGWEAAGRASAGPFAAGSTVGGFRATIIDHGDGTATVYWRFDGY